MRFQDIALWPLAAQAINIISSNDDGWAEVNIRALFDSLGEAGHSVVVSAPAENQSGMGSRQKPPSTLTKPCEFDSCPSGSPAVGQNVSEPRLGYVNSYPVTSIKYGIESRAPQFFDGPPDLAVAGPNVGNNIGLEVYFSGTVGAATYAADTAGIPGIAFSGASGSQTSWNTSRPHYSDVYADLAVNLTNQVVAAGKPYLPNDIWLNVNFGKVTASECAHPKDFSFVLSRIHVAIPLITPDDVTTCGTSRLPSEIEVSLASGCYASVSVGLASSKNDANATMQGAVLAQLGDFLSCLSFPEILTKSLLIISYSVEVYRITGLPDRREASMLKDLQARSLLIIQWNEYRRLYSIGDTPSGLQTVPTELKFFKAADAEPTWERKEHL